MKKLIATGDKSLVFYFPDMTQQAKKMKHSTVPGWPSPPFLNNNKVMKILKDCKA